ncbi:MAG: hypothetical protein HZB15_12560 [Actinobacteria bacterium]|nr:hypothetical protein [Actinomycetota bacterium]
MHPIERLRFVARASGGDQRMLVRETAGAIRGLQFEPAGLVIACRRIVERHPTSGPLWWFCSSLLTAADPFRAAYDLATEVENDPTPDHLFDALPDDASVCVVGWPDLIGDAIMRRGDIRVLAIDADDEGASFVRRLQRADIDAEVVPPGGAAAAAVAADLVLVEALAAGDDEVLVPAPSRAAASVAYCSEAPVWLVAGRGPRLPRPLFDAMLERVGDVRVDVHRRAGRADRRGVGRGARTRVRHGARAPASQPDVTR